MEKIIVPPIKIQGIKTKLIPSILENISFNRSTQRWVEPFLGSGVVAFNVRPKKALLSDINPHIIKFYKTLQNDVDDVFPRTIKYFLQCEGEKLFKSGGDYYYEVRDRFNKEHSSLDFLFLSRAGFNGMMRFSKNGYNVPFCKKPNRFSPALITKICNQVRNVQKVIHDNDYIFEVADFRKIVSQTGGSDFLFIDSPYIGRSDQYMDSWKDSDAEDLAIFLNSTKAKFFMTMWESNKYRTNSYLNKFSSFNKITKEHFYHVGSKTEYRNSVKEAFIFN